MFGILGPLEAARDGRPIPLGAAKERALLALLVLRPREVVSIDSLIDSLWGPEPPGDPARSIHVLVSRLRKALGSEAIVTRGRGYALAADAEDVDANRFGSLADSGRASLDAGDAATAASTLREALALWRGQPFADLPAEQALEAERHRLDELRLATLETRIEADLALGRHAVVLPELQALVREHPLREGPIAQLMLAQYRCGRQADALETYRQARARLVETLGLEPGSELQQLEREILQQAPSLGRPDRPRARPARRRRRRLFAGAIIVALLAGGALAVVLNRSGQTVQAALVGPNSVAIIDPSTGQVVGSVPVGARPVGIAAGSGALWVANSEDGTVQRIDPGTRAVVKTIGIGAPATDVAATARWVWIGNGSEGTLSRIDPRSDSLAAPTELPGQDRVFRNGEYGIAVSANKLWVASRRRAVFRLDAATGRVEERIGLDAAPLAIAARGSTVLVATARNQIVRIDAGSGRKADPIAVDAPTVIATGATGAWVGSHPAEGIEPGGVYRLDPNNLKLGIRSLVRDPVAIAITAREVWVASGEDERIYRIDPRTGAKLATIRLGGAPAGLALAHGDLWVTVDAPD